MIADTWIGPPRRRPTSSDVPPGFQESAGITLPFQYGCSFLVGHDLDMTDIPLPLSIKIWMPPIEPIKP